MTGGAAVFETMVTVVGIVAGEITQRRSEEDTTIAQFRLLAKERKYVRESDAWVDGDRMFLSIRCWRKLGENVAALLKRGDRVIVTGRLYHREYETQGYQRLSVEVDARSVGPDLSAWPVTVDRERAVADVAVAA
ncbi:MAG: single-stranded DNA-binding protein [Actinomycetota bacterium]|nr:single-stranded DNA-binding protein [Actinomycetota bacterium]